MYAPFPSWQVNLFIARIQQPIFNVSIEPNRALTPRIFTSCFSYSSKFFGKITHELFFFLNEVGDVMADGMTPCHLMRDGRATILYGRPLIAVYALLPTAIQERISSIVFWRQIAFTKNMAWAENEFQCFVPPEGWAMHQYLQLLVAL